MKYILRNVLSLFQRERTAAVCLVCGFLISAVALLFLFGLYYQVAQKNLANVNGLQHMEMEMETLQKDITWKRVKRCFNRLDKDTLKAVSGIVMKAAVDGDLEDYYGSFNFDYTLDEKGTPAYLDMTESLQSMGQLYEGRWFTRDEFDHGERVALGLGYDYTDFAEQKEYTVRYEDGSKDKYLIDGKSYRRIGAALLWTTPTIPVTCLKDDAPVIALAFGFKNVSVTAKQYGNIKEVFDEEFSGALKVPEKDFKELDSNYYLLMTLLLVSVGILTAVVLSLLLTYVCQQQEGIYAVCRLCGMEKKKSVAYFATECALLSFVCFVAAAIPYMYFAVPRITDVMAFFGEGYTGVSLAALCGSFLMGNVIVSSIIAAERLTKRGIV
ncbi:MAG: FtsX-like permease family protein [Lachnospiraceae bacterium]|nr:FtsX-like permease family protein [Lachnospiraceae bacterium]